MQSREEMLDRMRYLYRGLSAIENETNRKNNTVAQIQQLQKQINFEAERRRKGINYSQIDVGKKKNKATSIVGVISGVFFSIVFLIALGITALINSTSPDQADKGLTVFFLGGIFVVGVVVTVILTVATRGVVGGVNNKIVETSRAAIPDAENKIVSYQASIDSMVESLYDADSKIAISYMYIQDLVKAFPPDYCYSYAVGKFISYIQNLRADSLKEAINLFEDEEYKNQMLAEQRKQTEFAKISAAANLQTAYNTGQIANYSRQIAANTADIAESNRMIAANTKAAADYAAASAAYARQEAGYVKDIRDRVCPSFWD
ncbi:MAG: hypothetical protein K6G22_11620 [Lachnospiraceae bacterium]|nr:hypothetical protein [Lachnospiraceae bacterium]